MSAAVMAAAATPIQMCIRDSLGESLVADMPIGAFQAVRQGQTSTAPVSYTHLDVYKRQICRGTFSRA